MSDFFIFGTVYVKPRKTKKMKTLIILSIAAFAAACGTTKETTDPVVVEEVIEEVIETVETDEPPVEPFNRVLGTVHLNDGCGVYIEVLDGLETKLMYPVNLDETYKTEGTRIKFEYARSRAMQPAGCSVDMTVSVSDVTRMRE